MGKSKFTFVKRGQLGAKWDLVSYFVTVVLNSLPYMFTRISDCLFYHSSARVRNLQNEQILLSELICLS